MPPTSPALADFAAVITLPVNWGEMDALGHVNNSVYFKYFESARLAYLEQIGAWDLLREHGITTVLASTQARYRLPLTYPDTIEVGARVAALMKDRFAMDYAVYSRRHQRVATQGSGLVVSVGREDGRKTPLPEALKRRIEASMRP